MMVATARVRLAAHQAQRPHATSDGERPSIDNGATWSANQDHERAQSAGCPTQPDSNIQPVYEGDYDYASADGNNTYSYMERRAHESSVGTPSKMYSATEWT